MGFGYSSAPKWRIYCRDHESNVIVKELKDSFTKMLQRLDKFVKSVNSIDRLRECSEDLLNTSSKPKDELKVELLLENRGPAKFQKKKVRVHEPVLQSAQHELVEYVTNKKKQGAHKIPFKRVRGAGGRFLSKKSQVASQKRANSQRDTRNPMLAEDSESLLFEVEDDDHHVRQRQLLSRDGTLPANKPAHRATGKKARLPTERRGQAEHLSDLHIMDIMMEEEAAKQSQDDPTVEKPLGKRKKPNLSAIPEQLLPGLPNNKKLKRANKVDLDEVCRLKDLAGVKIDSKLSDRQERHIRLENLRVQEAEMRFQLTYDPLTQKCSLL